MKLWIPKVSDRLRLTEEWEFPLFVEYRNRELAIKIDKTLSQYDRYVNGNESIGCCLPIGTVLRVDRVYIRSGSSSEYNSLTFRIEECPNKEYKAKRFWAKLTDVNNIIYEVVE